MTRITTPEEMEQVSQQREQYDVHGITHEHGISPTEQTLVETGRLADELILPASLNRCALKHGDSGLVADFGGSFSRSLRDSIGTGYHCVNVQLAGWYFDFTRKDHHINTVSVRFRNIRYNRRTGLVTWTVNGYYQDKNGDDDYYWRVWWTILALG
jgi:hypothetical protein